jgi:uncharacterized linocin/CFP29 family protein
MPSPAAKVPWSAEVWKAIQRAVNDETKRVQVGAKFLPHRHVHPHITSVDADTVKNARLPGESQSTLTVDEGASIRLNEIWTEFALTTQQVEETAKAKNPGDTTAVTLARRAAQYLALAQDVVIFQGKDGYTIPFFSQNVRFRAGQIPADGGLLCLTGEPAYLSPNPVIRVHPLPGSPRGVTYGENTFNAVTQSYSVLTGQGQPGPYALILNTAVYADLYASIGTGSLVTTAQRVEPLVKAGLFGTGTVPPSPGSPAGGPYYGVLVSIGGDTMDLVVGQDATTEFMQQDPNELWRFGVMERFALRVFDSSAIQVIEFMTS